MHRRGPSRGRIADLVRVLIRTVACHLAATRTRDPGLEDEHAAAAGNLGSTAFTAKDRERMDQLIGHIRSEGRDPSSKSLDPAKRTLAAWLGRRRRETTAGTLALPIRDGLDSIPDWQEPARAAEAEARWQARLVELAAYPDAGSDLASRVFPLPPALLMGEAEGQASRH